MNQRHLKVGTIRDVSGEVNIAGGDVYKGYSAQEVSFLLKEITSTFQPKPFDGRCPYKGLDVFEEEDAELFFGREKLVASLIDRVHESRAIFITGPSGSGKSSFVRAGLIPALKQGAIRQSHSERWLYETIKPGRDPIESLALVFSRLKSPQLANYFRESASNANILYECAESVLSGRKNQRFLLFIDQFEEVFTQVSQEKAATFINVITNAQSLEDSRIIILFAMRSDFISNCATYPKLNDLLNQKFIQIGAMQPNELVSAVAQPALGVGLHIDPNLIAQIMNDMQGEPGALPLMQFALKDLFDSLKENGGAIALTLNHYFHRGGIHKSLERHADNVFAKLSESEQQLAHSIFSRLIEVGRGTQDTRRTALFDELISTAANAVDVQSVVQKLANARLITTGEQAGKETITISHEKLIDAWPWLKRLVNENRDRIALQNEIIIDAKEWDDHNRDRSYLYSGARLATAQEKIGNLMLSESAYAFLETSKRVDDDARLRLERSRRRVILGLFSFSAVILSLFIFSSFQLKISRAQQLGFQAQDAFAERNYNIAALFAYQSYQIRPNDAAKRVLENLPYENFELGKGLLGHTSSVYTVAWSADGRLASGSEDGAIIIWDLSTGQPAQTMRVPMKGNATGINLAWSADGRLAIGAANYTVIIWNPSTDESTQILQMPEKGNIGGSSDVSWSADGRLASSSWDNSVIIWDLSTSQPAQVLQGSGDWVASVAWSADGRLASSSADGSIIIWNLATGQPTQTLRENKTYIMKLAWSANGYLASGSADGSVIIWDLATGRPARVLKENEFEVWSLAWSTDNCLASGSSDGSITIWDLATSQPAVLLDGHTNGATSLAWSADGRLASGSFDNTVIIWSLSSDQPAQTLKGDTEEVTSVDWSADGRLASGSFDNTVIVWDLSTSQSAQTLKGHTAGITSVDWSADGRLASGSLDNTVIVWDLSTSQPAQTLKGHTFYVKSVDWSADGRLASGSSDGTIILWDLSTGQPGQILKGYSDYVENVAWSADGRLASGSADGTIILWDLSTGQPAQTLKVPLNKGVGGINDVAWSGDGRLASGSTNGSVIIWDLATGQPEQIIKEPLDANTVAYARVAWSIDGRLVSSVWDNTIVWDLSTGQPAQFLGGSSSVAWSTDGRLAIGSANGTVKIPKAGFIEHKPCDWLLRNMTVNEWLAYQGVLVVYRPACANLSDPTLILYSMNDLMEDISNTLNKYYAGFPLPAFEDLNIYRYLITWKGRAIFFLLAFALLFTLLYILWMCSKLAKSMYQMVNKRFRASHS